MPGIAMVMPGIAMVVLVLPLSMVVSVGGSCATSSSPRSH
jgi:hypothetical protein